MVSGHAFVEELIAREIDLFSLGQLRLFLELNAIVLCGHDEQMRAEATEHLAATEKHFFDNMDGGIRDMIEWHALHAGESAWIRAAGVYIRKWWVTIAGKKVAHHERSRPMISFDEQLGLAQDGLDCREL